MNNQLKMSQKKIKELNNQITISEICVNAYKYQK